MPGGRCSHVSGVPVRGFSCIPGRRHAVSAGRASDRDAMGRRVAAAPGRLRREALEKECSRRAKPAAVPASRWPRRVQVRTMSTSVFQAIGLPTASTRVGGAPISVDSTAGIKRRFERQFPAESDLDHARAARHRGADHRKTAGLPRFRVDHRPDPNSPGGSRRDCRAPRPREGGGPRCGHRSRTPVEMAASGHPRRVIRAEPLRSRRRRSCASPASRRRRVSPAPRRRRGPRSGRAG